MISEKSYEVHEGNGNDIIERLLDSRGETAEDVKDAPMHSPWLIDGMEQVAGRIEKAVRDGERIAICGDYDTDGTSASMIMEKGLKRLGADVTVFIPDRLSEGYGLNERMVGEINDGGYGLAVTVDNGIRSGEQIAMLDCDCVVTDHHEPGPELPECAGVIDCSRKDNTYPFPSICGAVMAYKTMEAVYERMGRNGEQRFLLTYAAIGTIGDVMPLLDENRTIVREGLDMLSQTKDPGLAVLVETALDGHPVTAENVAFYVSPFANAASRIGSVNTYLSLLRAETPTMARAYADELRKNNEKRRMISASMLNDANEKIMKDYDFSTYDPIIVSGDYHKGVIGITAGKLAEFYNRPAAVIDEKTGTGSCRSVGDISVMEWLDACAESLDHYGGHKGAAGFTVADLDAFRRMSHDYAAAHWHETIPKEQVDLEVKSSDVTLATIDRLSTLEPFGHDNPKPKFIMRNVPIERLSRAGKQRGAEGTHLQVLTASGKSGIGFGIGDYADIIKHGEKVDIVFGLERNTFRGKNTPQMMVSDIIYTPRTHPLDRLPGKDDFVRLMRTVGNVIRKESPALTTEAYITALVENQTGYRIPPVGPMLKCLDESGNITFRKTGKGIIIARPTEGRQKTKITETETFRSLRRQMEKKKDARGR